VTDVKPLRRRALEAVLLAARQPRVSELAWSAVPFIDRFSPRGAAALKAELPLGGKRRVVFPDGRTMYLWGGSSGREIPLIRQVLKNGVSSYEPEVALAFTALAAQAEVVFDIGAHVGLYSLLATWARSDVRLFAFEPVTEIFELLKRNLDINELANATCVKVAVGETSGGDVPLFSRASVVDTIASSEPRHRITWDKGPWCCEFVARVSIDDFMGTAQLSRLDLVKIDVEMAERQVLAGMRQTIAKYRPHVFCEVFPDEWLEQGTAAAMEDVLRPHDYKFYLLTPEGPVQRDRLAGDKERWNQLFTTLDAPELHQALAGCRRDRS
jgi:FkbM family methyltransferase